VLGALLAIWRHTASTRAKAEAVRYEALAHRHAEQGAFLKLLTDTAPDVLLVADAEGTCHFANRAAGAVAGVDAADLGGKGLRAILGPGPGKVAEERVRSALQNSKRLTAVDRQENPLKVTLAEVEPMEGNSRALIALRDITELVSKREHAERVVRETVSALVSIIDRRDPHAAEHSRRVAALAHDVAVALELDPVLVDAAEMAGLLSNVGKILLPSELLTRPDRLSREELDRVREAVRGGANLLKGIAFPGPVVETLRQMGERWDGKGQPAGLTEENILITARIVAAANTFVALTRTRADRPAMSVDEAVDVILKDAGKAFDRRVATALAFVASRDSPAA
jgi:PAS domain S-box-containing protein